MFEQQRPHFVSLLFARGNVGKLCSENPAEAQFRFFTLEVLRFQRVSSVFVARTTTASQARDAASKCESVLPSDGFPMKLEPHPMFGYIPPLPGVGP